MTHHLIHSVVLSLILLPGTFTSLSAVKSISPDSSGGFSECSKSSRPRSTLLIPFVGNAWRLLSNTNPLYFFYFIFLTQTCQPSCLEFWGFTISDKSTQHKSNCVCGVQYTPPIAMIIGQSTRDDVKVKWRSIDSFEVLIFGQQLERGAKFKHETRTFHIWELAPSTVSHRDFTKLIWLDLVENLMVLQYCGGPPFSPFHRNHLPPTSYFIWPHVPLAIHP